VAVIVLKMKGLLWRPFAVPQQQLQQWFQWQQQPQQQWSLRRNSQSY